LFIERLENTATIDSLRCAETKSRSHHHLPGGLLVSSTRSARADKRGAKKTTLSSDEGKNKPRQQALTLSHPAPQAQAGGYAEVQA
jgi:hypothetical protein